MADNLTVTGKSGAPAPAETATDQRVDTGKAELERLREAAKNHFGRELSDGALATLVARREAKLTHQKNLEESKQTFETAQGRETLSQQEVNQQRQTQKTTGAEKSKGADGLTEKDRQEIRSDPKAAAKLPPPPSKATTPEQAGLLLDRILQLVNANGEPIDRKAYADTLQEKPPSTGSPGQERQTLTGKGLTKASAGLQAAGEDPTNRAATPRAAGQSPADRTATSKTAGQSPAPRAAVPTPGRQPTPFGREGSGAALNLPRPATAAAAFRAAPPDSLASSTTVSNDGLFNAGGGLITNSSFEGMSFNWDAFQWRFTLMVMKDFHYFRKLMKELRRLQGKAALSGMKLQEALERMRQTFDRNRATAKFFDALKSACGTIWTEYKKLEIAEATGKTQGEIDELNKQKAATQKELDNLEKLQKTTKADLEAKRGTSPAKADKASSGAAVDEPSPEIKAKQRELKEIEDQLAKKRQEKAELAQEAKRYGSGQLGELAEKLADKKITNPDIRPEMAAYANTLRGLNGHREIKPALEGRGEEIANAYRLAAKAAKEAPGDEQKKKLRDLLGRKLRIQTASMASITEPKDRERAVAEAKKKKAELEQEAETLNEQATAQASTDPTQAKKTEDEAGEKNTKAKEIGDALGFLQQLSTEPPPDVADLVNTLSDATALTVEELLRNARQGGFMNTLNRVADLGSQVFDKLSEVAESGVTSSRSAVDTLVSTSVAADFAARADANALLRRASGQAQGMINQLMQLSRMARRG